MTDSQLSGRQQAGNVQVERLGIEAPTKLVTSHRP